MWEVFVVEYARAHAQPLANLVFGAHGGPAVDVPYSFVAARSPHGVLLVDCGFFADVEPGRVHAARNDVRTWVSPLRLLAAIGIGADDVNDIIVSHAHFDHMGGIAAFPRARLHMQRRELFGAIEALALPPSLGFLVAGIEPADLHAALHAAGQHRLNLLDGDCDNLLPGVHVRLAADSHTPGSVWVEMDTAKGRLAVSGDCIYCYQNLAAARTDRRHAPLGYATGSVWQQLLAMERISAAVGGDLSRLIILHDLDRWRLCETVADIDGMRVARAA